MDTARARRSHRTLIAAVAAAAAFGLTACGGSSEAADTSGGAGYPEDDITVIVPFAAGGPTDTVTRMVADPMGADLGVQMVVSNVEGAGGTVGAAEAATADPDGYTLLLHHIGMSTAPSLYPDLPYSPTEDFEPVGLVTRVPMTIIARGDFQPATLADLVTYVKANADTVTYAHAGKGSASNLCGLLLEKELGVDLQEVPYDGTGPAMTDLVGGQVDFMCDQTTNTSGQIRAGEVKAYAVTSDERVASLPDLPTTAEAGHPDVAVTVWHGLYAPKGTSPEVVERLSKGLQTSLADQAVVDQMADLGTAPVDAADATPDALRTTLAEQTQQWSSLIGQA